MILALALAVVVLGLVGVGIHVHLAVAAKSRDQVEEAQLARVLLQRIADDLRNAVPFQPPASSRLPAISSRRRPRSPRGRSLRALPAWPVPPARRIPSSTTPLSGGIYGTAQAIQIETARRPRATLVSLQTTRQRSQPARPAERYSRRILQPRGAEHRRYVATRVPRRLRATGLYRHEQDRAEFFYASQNGQTDESDPATELLAPEVVDFQLTYYGGTGGTSSSGTTSSGTTSERHGQRRHDAAAAHRPPTRTADGTTNDNPMGFDASGHVARRREDFDFPPPRSAEIVAQPARHREAAAGRLLLARQSAQCEGGHEPGQRASRRRQRRRPTKRIPVTRPVAARVAKVAKVAKVVKPAKAAVSAVRRAVRRVAVSVAVASAAASADAAVRLGMAANAAANEAVEREAVEARRRRWAARHRRRARGR